MQKKQLVWKNQYNYLLIITLLFFTLDCMIAQTTPGIDRNILISAPFFVFFLFFPVPCGVWGGDFPIPSRIPETCPALLESCEAVGV